MGAYKLRVLVIDDEPMVADSLAQILNMFGYHALSAYSAQAAIDHVGATPCDLVISDVVMDGKLSGIDLAIQLTTLMPSCRVLLMSGNNSTAELLSSAQQKGYTFEVLTKPVHPTEILERLRTLETE
ncbi:MAG TPA: response regulator [Terracidiphilus sp.]|nr:response regulator [Terracidiphilus sp.]